AYPNADRDVPLGNSASRHSAEPADDPAGEVRPAQANGCLGLMNDESRLREFALRYAEAWSVQNPAAVAEFFAPKASLTINGGTPAVGRVAIANEARAFMTAFPDMRVTFDKLVRRGESVEFHWTLDGHNTGPGGSGNHVRISGFESWK